MNHTGEKTMIGNDARLKGEPEELPNVGVEWVTRQSKTYEHGKVGNRKKEPDNCTNVRAPPRVGVSSSAVWQGLAKGRAGNSRRGETRWGSIAAPRLRGAELKLKGMTKATATKEAKAERPPSARTSGEACLGKLARRARRRCRWRSCAIRKSMGTMVWMVSHVLVLS